MNFYQRSSKNNAYFHLQVSNPRNFSPFTHDLLESPGRRQRGGYMNQSTHPSHAGDDDDEDEDEDDEEEEDDDDANDDDANVRPSKLTQIPSVFLQ